MIDNQNVFEVLVEAVRCCSLGQITNALFEVGGSTGGVCEVGSRLRTARSHLGNRSVSSRFYCAAKVLRICIMHV